MMRIHKIIPNPGNNNISPSENTSGRLIGVKHGLSYIIEATFDAEPVRTAENLSF